MKIKMHKPVTLPVMVVVAYIKGGTEIKGLREEGTEENLWMWEQK